MLPEEINVRLILISALSVCSKVSNEIATVSEIELITNLELHPCASLVFESLY